ncbi:MAG TPA: N-acetylmuramoyl-L-alanine amidase [Longimicrobium sp.]|nr:N-acetylmuramoyl-L-alanine amidase [Longimicrobium sp.]
MATLYSKIPGREAEFRAKGVDSDGKQFKLAAAKVDIPGTTQSLEVVTANLASGDKSFYYAEAVAKERIVVHFTAGYLWGDMAALTKKDNHVSVPFVVARDGTIYQLFSSKYWSYHLGKGAQGGNEAMSKSSIAIELSNVAYLRDKDGNLVDPYGNVYCTPADTAAYQTLTKAYRGYTKFATFTDAQYTSLASLLKYLTATYKIPAAFLPEDKRYDVYADVAKFKGITTHVNYQPESYGKWDIGPAFDWARVIAALGTVPVSGVATPATTG